MLPLNLALYLENDPVVSQKIPIHMSLRCILGTISLMYLLTILILQLTAILFPSTTRDWLMPNRDNVESM